MTEADRAPMHVLVCNAGSSSLKFSLFEACSETQLVDGGIDWQAQPARMVMRVAGLPDVRAEVSLQSHGEAMARIIHSFSASPIELPTHFEKLHAVGHRVVHGGDKFTCAVRITPEVKQAIGGLAELAPLHNPASLEVIEKVEEVIPQAPQFAAFDTAFHTSMPEYAKVYPVPRSWTRDLNIHRFGFHGLSIAYCARRAIEMLGKKNARLIIAHLGNGASITAVCNGTCIDTSMGFTPLDGLMMGTRSGTIDPGIIMFLQRHRGMDADSLDHALNFESGLLGVSGLSGDMRAIVEAMPTNPDAKLAFDIYAHRVRQTIGSMAAVLGGVDALIFTGGIGENSAPVRQAACKGLDFLGLQIDRAANEACKPDSEVGYADARGRILVIATREDLTVAREVRKLMEQEASNAVARA
ncbi:acetate kinase [bacterium]|nr:acetate kinase [bacterium]